MRTKVLAAAIVGACLLVGGAVLLQTERGQTTLSDRQPDDGIRVRAPSDPDARHRGFCAPLSVAEADDRRATELLGRVTDGSGHVDRSLRPFLDALMEAAPEEVASEAGVLRTAIRRSAEDRTPLLPLAPEGERAVAAIDEWAVASCDG